MQRVVNECLIAEAVRHRGIRVTDAELQSGLDEFRRAKRLESAQAMREWMAVNGGSQYELERTIETRLAARKLRDEIAGGREREYFDLHRADFDVTRAVRLGPLEEQEAVALRARLVQERKPLVAEVVDRFARGVSDRARTPLVVIRRRSLAPSDAEVLFAARPGELVGPLRSGPSYDLLEVLSVTSPTFDDDVIQEVRDAMLAEWLADARQRAEIRWFWGRGSDVPHEP